MTMGDTTELKGGDAGGRAANNASIYFLTQRIHWVVSFTAVAIILHPRADLHRSPPDARPGFDETLAGSVAAGSAPGGAVQAGGADAAEAAKTE